MKTTAETLITLFAGDKNKFEKHVAKIAHKEFLGYYDDETFYLFADSSLINIDDEWINVYHHVDYDSNTEECNFTYEPVLEIYIGKE